jgi:hypothetical protein
MEARVAELEQIAKKTAEHLGNLERDVAVIKSNYATKADIVEVKGEVTFIKLNYATKADMLEMKNSIIMWVVSAFFLTQLLPGLLKRFGLS